MNKPIELDIITIDYSKIKKLTRKLENLDSKLNNSAYNRETIQAKMNTQTSILSSTIKQGNKKNKKFRLVISMGNLSSKFMYNDITKIMYDFNEFFIYPNTPFEINANNFIADIYSKASFYLVDEENYIFALRKYLGNYAISLTDNECTFIAQENIYELKREILRLINNLCSKCSKLSINDKIKFGIYREKIESLFDSVYSLTEYNFKEYYLAGINPLSFNELISKIVVKFFMGEALKDFEKIIITKLTASQILDILNFHIQNNYDNQKLNNYLNSIKMINNIPGSINFRQYVESKDCPIELLNNRSSIGNNVIEVDFFNRIIKK